MYGAIIGDLAGSKYEHRSIKTKDFPFISRGCSFTDDTVMTMAVARALLESLEKGTPFKAALIGQMQQLGRRYPHAGYGGRFRAWLRQDEPKPYGSYGNGSAMRASPCGLIAVTLEEAIALARASSVVTHDHPEGIKGAEATAAAVFMAKTGSSKQQIRDYIRGSYYPLDQTLDEIRPEYRFHVSCQRSVPQAIEAFLESESYEDAIRNAVSLGGDSDTQAAIAGGIAWSYYRFGHDSADMETNKKPGRVWPDSCDRMIRDYEIDGMLPVGFVDTIEQFDIACAARAETFAKTGTCPQFDLTDAPPVRSILSRVDLDRGISELMARMIEHSGGNIHDIGHLTHVWTYARTIGKLEGLDRETQFILETAAITHDIACPLCREKYGSADGKHQEEEGPALVRAFLADTGMTPELIERVAYLVGHHHTLSGIDGIDHQILIEADYIVNASEGGYDRQTVEAFIDKYIRTRSGKRLARAIFCQ